VLVVCVFTSHLFKLLNSIAHLFIFCFDLRDLTFLFGKRLLSLREVVLGLVRSLTSLDGFRAEGFKGLLLLRNDYCKVRGSLLRCLDVVLALFNGQGQLLCQCFHACDLLLQVAVFSDCLLQADFDVELRPL